MGYLGRHLILDQKLNNCLRKSSMGFCRKVFCGSLYFMFIDEPTNVHSYHISLRIVAAWVTWCSWWNRWFGSRIFTLVAQIDLPIEAKLKTPTSLIETFCCGLLFWKVLTICTSWLLQPFVLFLFETGSRLFLGQCGLQWNRMTRFRTRRWKGACQFPSFPPRISGQILHTNLL